MIILVDSREQNPLRFKVAGSVEGVEKATLNVGDYAVRFRDLTQPPVVFERKAMGDLFGTMTQGYPRFKKELRRAKEGGIDLILIIEGTLGDVLDGTAHSKFSGESMVQKLFTMQVRYAMPVVFSANRIEMARHIVEYFEAIGREHVILAKAKKVVDFSPPIR